MTWSQDLAVILASGLDSDALRRLGEGVGYVPGVPAAPSSFAAGLVARAEGTGSLPKLIDAALRVMPADAERLFALEARAPSFLVPGPLDLVGAAEVTLRLVVANPMVEALTVDQEADSIARIVRAGSARHRWSIRRFNDADFTDLADAARFGGPSRDARAGLPDVVHFAGHGLRGCLVLHGDTVGTVAMLNPAEAQLLFQPRGEDRIDLVVLNGCQTAELAVILRSLVNVAIGTGRSIDDGAARAFSKLFYRMLAAGASVREAFDLGVAAAGQADPSSAGTYQLLARDGVDPAAFYLPTLQPQEQS